MAGILTWASGTLGADTAITVSPHGQLHLVGDTARSLQGMLTNAGTVQWAGSGDFVLARVLHNRAGGLFEIQNDRSLSWAIGGAPVFINDGVVRESAGTSTTAGGVPLINNGRVDTQSGVLTLATGNLLNSGCVFEGGWDQPPDQEPERRHHSRFYQ